MQTKALFEFAVEFFIAQSDDARRFSAFLSPYQRRALSAQRKNGKRSGGEKMFFGAAVMVAPVADGDDDTGFIVFPAMGGDPGPLAQLCARAVGGPHHAPRAFPAARPPHAPTPPPP